MRIPRVPLLTFLLVSGLLAVTAHPALAAEIKCGSVLGPGGTFVLDRDLICPYNPDSDGVTDPALTVAGGATLDLNGHTVSCIGGGQGITVVLRSTVLNGRVTGCGVGVTLSFYGNVVQGMTVKRNGWGMYLQVSHDNLITRNIAIGNYIGFGLEDGSSRNTLSNNTAKGNRHYGFYTDSGTGNVFIENTATDNSRGFSMGGSGAFRLLHNIARRNNGVGFRFENPGRVKLIANVAEDNQTQGFSLEHLGHKPGRSILRDNVAQGNGGDGFLISPAFEAGDPSANVLDRNSAISNKGHGIHVIDGYVNRPKAPYATITGSFAFGHTAPHFDLADDNADCQEGPVWQDNHFLTASQSCIE